MKMTQAQQTILDDVEVNLLEQRNRLELLSEEVTSDKTANVLQEIVVDIIRALNLIRLPKP